MEQDEESFKSEFEETELIDNDANPATSAASDRPQLGKHPETAAGRSHGP